MEKSATMTHDSPLDVAAAPQTAVSLDQRVVKRSIVINGHKTSVSLESDFWKGLRQIAEIKQTTLSKLIASIDSQRKNGNLSSAIRLFVLGYHQAQCPAPSVPLARS